MLFRPSVRFASVRATVHPLPPPLYCSNLGCIAPHTHVSKCRSWARVASARCSWSEGSMTENRSLKRTTTYVYVCQREVQCVVLHFGCVVLAIGRFILPWRLVQRRPALIQSGRWRSYVAAVNQITQVYAMKVLTKSQIFRDKQVLVIVVLVWRWCVRRCGWCDVRWQWW